MKRTLFISTLCVVGGVILCLGIIIAVVFLSVVSGAIFAFAPDPAEPNIKQATFPFSITYEADGETRIYKDAVVCKYDGISSAGSSKHLTWDSRLRSGNEEVVLWHSSEKDNTAEKIVYSQYGSAKYYMGDYNGDSYDFGGLKYYKYINGELQESENLTEQEALERFNLKIIESKFTPPVKNIFS